MKGYIQRRVAYYRWIGSEYQGAWARAWANPKRALTKAAFVAPIAFAFYMIYLHSPAAAAGPGPACQAWATSVSGTPGALSQALSDMTGGSTVQAWMNNAIGVVAVIFWALMVVQLTQDVIDYMFQTAGSGSLAGFFGQYGRILIMNLLIAGLFTNLPTIVYDFFSGASYVGQQVTGVAPAPWYSDIFSFQPGLIANEGVCVSDEMDASFSTLAQKSLTWDWGNMGKSITGVLEYVTGWITASLIGGTIAEFAFMILAIIFTFVALEVFFVAGLGMITLGGMSHRALWFIPFMYRTAAFGLFMKVAALGAISAFGAHEADTWAGMIANASSLDQLIPIAKEVMYGAVGFALLGGFMPGIVSKHFGGGYMGSQATMAIGRVGSNVQQQASGQRFGGARTPGGGSPSGGARTPGGAPSSQQSAPRTPTMSGTP